MSVLLLFLCHYGFSLGYHLSLYRYFLSCCCGSPLAGCHLALCLVFYCTCLVHHLLTLLLFSLLLLRLPSCWLSSCTLRLLLPWLLFWLSAPLCSLLQPLFPCADSSCMYLSQQAVIIVLKEGLWVNLILSWPGPVWKHEGIKLMCSEAGLSTCIQVTDFFDFFPLRVQLRLKKKWCSYDLKKKVYIYIYPQDKPWWAVGTCGGQVYFWE